MNKDDQIVDPMTLLDGKTGAVSALVNTNRIAVPDEAAIEERIRSSNLTPAQQGSLLKYAHTQMGDASAADKISNDQAKKRQTAGSPTTN